MWEKGTESVWVCVGGGGGGEGEESTRKMSNTTMPIVLNPVRQTPINVQMKDAHLNFHSIDGQYSNFFGHNTLSFFIGNILIWSAALPNISLKLMYLVSLLSDSFELLGSFGFVIHIAIGRTKPDMFFYCYSLLSYLICMGLRLNLSPDICTWMCSSNLYVLFLVFVLFCLVQICMLNL